MQKQLLITGAIVGVLIFGIVGWWMGGLGLGQPAAVPGAEGAANPGAVSAPVASWPPATISFGTLALIFSIAALGLASLALGGVILLILNRFFKWEPGKRNAPVEGVAMKEKTA